MTVLTKKKVYGKWAHMNLLTDEYTLTGPYGEVFEFNEAIGKVVVFNVSVANQINELYAVNKWDVRAKRGDEPVFVFRIKDLSAILRLIGYRELELPIGNRVALVKHEEARG